MRKIRIRSEKDEAINYEPLLGCVNSAKKYMAKYMALSNAAEFIRGHCETGHAYEDEKLQDEYSKQQISIANQLDRRAMAALELYKKTGVELNLNLADGC
jgi:hypothetical protein